MANTMGMSYALSEMAGDSYEVAEMKLLFLFKTYYCEVHLRSQIERFLVTQFKEVQDAAIQKLILKHIFKLDYNVIERCSKHMDVLSMLRDPRNTTRRMAVDIIEKYYTFYEFDECVIFAVRKHKRIRRLMANNALYKKAFKIKEESTKPKRHFIYEYKNLSDIIEKNKTSLLECRTYRAFKMDLSQLIDQSCGFYLNLILCYFIKKIEQKLITSTNMSIPGLTNMFFSHKIEEVDVNAQLFQYNLKSTPDYRLLKMIYSRIEK